MKKKTIKKRLKTISDEDIEQWVIWKCPYCGLKNKEWGDFISEADKIECNYCKNITRVKEPKY